MEARARAQFGVGVVFSEPKPTVWTQNQTYGLQKILPGASPISSQVRANLDTGIIREGKVTLKMKYGEF
jgi:hypothetical protein